MRVLTVDVPRMNVENAQTETVASTNNKGLYYNIVHGSFDSKVKWRCAVDSRHLRPKSPGDKLELTGDDYYIKPIVRNGKTVVARNGNVMYSLSVCSEPINSNDILALVTLPLSIYTEVKFTTLGECMIVGMSSNSKVRGENKIVVPAPVLEICGDFTLGWVGKIDKDNYTYQKISYNTRLDKWTFDIPTKFNGTEGRRLMMNMENK